jgi:outer membrane receptor protein involved in Fe transport
MRPMYQDTDSQSGPLSGRGSPGPAKRIRPEGELILKGVTWRRLVIFLFGFILLAVSAHAVPDTVILPETVVTAERVLEGDPAVAFWSRGEISSRGPRTIDELLSADPSFSLYRRQSSVFGHPTSSGVSLRGTGASATARTLVLRDGIPQNDPFGGWVPWARYTPELLSSVRIVPAAQSAVWGNQSPVGVVHLSGRTPDSNSARVRATGGSHGTRGLVLVNDQISDEMRLAARSSVFTLRSDGFYGLQRAQRGSVDRRLGLESRGGDFRLRWHPGDGVTVEPAFSFYEEDRGNGTVLSRNSTRALDFSLRVTGESPSLAWQATTYYQRRVFDALFSAVDDSRDVEVPALEQFDVPGEGAGGGVTAALDVGEDLDVVLGADLRFLNGETNEQAGFVDGAFLRGRRAGGEQFVGGVFMRGAYGRGRQLSLAGSARIDFWGFRNGERVERRPLTGILLRDNAFENRSGVDPSLSATLNYRVSDSVRIRTSAGTSFRLPTINELYRPFRVRSDITESNAGLEPEHFHAIDLGVEWTPSERFSCHLKVFHYWIDDVIANMPITDRDEAESIAGFLPPGGVLAQRRNIEQGRVRGLESRLEWQFSSRWNCMLRYLFSRARFTSSPEEPLLEGKAFPQSPEHRVIAGIAGTPLERLHLFAEIEFGSSQYDDVLGERRLGSWWTARLGGEVKVDERVTVQARIENLFDEEVATGLSSSGLRSIGQPRSAWINVNYRF